MTGGLETAIAPSTAESPTTPCDNTPSTPESRAAASGDRPSTAESCAAATGNALPTAAPDAELRATTGCAESRAESCPAAPGDHISLAPACGDGYFAATPGIAPCVAGSELASRAAEPNIARGFTMPGSRPRVTPLGGAALSAEPGITPDGAVPVSTGARASPR